MGLFSFLKGGNKKKTPSTPKAPTSNINADADRLIRQQKKMVLDNTVASLGVHIKNMNLDYYGDVVTVTGLAASEADMNKVVNALNNVDGIARVDNRMTVDAPKVETYVVQKGDSLSKIAKQFYGDPMKYKELFEANKDILDDPNKIFPGQELKIPK